MDIQLATCVNIDKEKASNTRLGTGDKVRSHYAGDCATRANQGQIRIVVNHHVTERRQHTAQQIEQEKFQTPNHTFKGGTKSREIQHVTNNVDKSPLQNVDIVQK